MCDIIVEIMVQVLTILAIATEEVKDGRLSELVVVYILPTILADRIFRENLQEVDGEQKF
jgi:hypothetical protein